MLVLSFMQKGEKILAFVSSNLIWRKENRGGEKGELCIIYPNLALLVAPPC